MVTSIIALVVYGQRITSMDDEYVITAQKVMDGFSKAMAPGAYLVELFPVLRHIPSWVPGTAARKMAEEYIPFVTHLINVPYARVKASLVRPYNQSCT